VAFLLPPVRREVLVEVALLVQQSDAEQRHAELARGLEVIPREDAEPARVDRQGLGQAELQREIRDERTRRRTVLLLVPGPGARDVGAESGDHRVQLREEGLILRQAVEPLLRHAPQHQHGVVA
jgi:hypothetical protein